MVQHRGLVVVERGVGFEADSFVEQICDAIGPVVTLDDASDAACLEPPMAVVSGAFARDLGPWRDVVVERHRAEKTTLVVLPQGSTGGALEQTPVPTLIVDAGSLRANVEDVLNQPADVANARVESSVAALVADLGEGWPAWVTGCLEAARTAEIGPGELVRVISGPTFRRDLVGRYLNEFDQQDVRHLAQLAHFDVFSDAVAQAVGGVRFAETVLPHTPGLFRTSSGALRICHPVRSELVLAHQLDPVVAEAVVPVMLADGQLLVACRTLIDNGLDRFAARIVAAVPESALDLSSQRDLLATFRVLEPHSEEFPTLRLKQARVHRNLGENLAAIELCEAALEGVEVDDDFYIEATIELLTYRYRLIAPDEAVVIVSQLKNRVDRSGPLATKLREVEARIMGQHPHDSTVVQVAADRLSEVASEWEYQQDRLMAARALRTRAAGPLWHFGRYREGQSSLERAAQLAVVQAFDYGVTLNLKARFDVQCADFDAYRRSAEQARFTVLDSGIGWLEGYLHWNEALAAGLDGSLEGVKRAYRLAKERLGEMFEADTGVVLCSEIAVQAARLGDLDFARQLLNEVRARRSTNELEFDIAEIIVAARGQDVHDAWERWNTLDASGDVPTDRRWQVELELGLGDRRASVPERIDLESVRREAIRLGLAELFDVIAPELSELIVLSDSDVSVRLLGGVEVQVGNTKVALPPGKATDLVSVLALESGQTVVDVVVDELWPEADRHLGQRRLKNVVTKARTALGPDSIVRSNETIEFGPRVSTDVAMFREQARLVEAKRRSDPSGARQAAVSALDMYAGPLLPAELYSDRINAVRFELQQRADALVDYLIDEHEPPAGWLAATLDRVRASQPEVL